MHIKGLEKLSCVDYPHHLACVIFLAGCNLRCRYCYNPHLVTRLHELPDIDKAEVFMYLEKRKHILEGICVSGGEATIYRDLPEFLSELRAFKLPIKLDTNGTHPEMIRSLIQRKLVDYIALDIKAPLNASYTDLTGIHQTGLRRIHETLRLIAYSGLDFEIRTTVIPTIHTDLTFEIMRCQILQTLGTDLPAGQVGFDRSRLHWYLQPFVPRNCLDTHFDSLPPTSTDMLNALAQRLRPTFPHVFVR